ncbi:MAG: glycosyltransferase, partial [Patescibacteria group bacterium]
MNHKIKIIYVTAALEVGGAEMFLYDLVKHIDRQSFDVSVATVIGGGSLEPQFKALGAPIFVFGGRYSKFLGGLCEARKLYHLFKKETPDIVHTQLFPADLWGRIAAKLAGVPRIVTTEQNVNVDQNCLRETLKRWTYKLADRVVAISTAVKKYTQESYCVPAEKIEIIPNDVDVDNLKSKISNLKTGDKKIILTVGRLVPQKGQKYLLEAFSILKNREGLELWLAGEGNLRSELEKQAGDLKIDNQVKFLGRRHDVPTLLAQADLFVFPSEWEGLGVAVLEAAARACLSSLR